MKTIYLVRHGESRANVRGTKYYEGAESPLTEKGLEQAKYIAERASKLPIDLLLASTMTRAQQTAAAIAQRTSLPVVSSELFIERKDPTSLVGQVWEDPEVQRIFKEWERTLFCEDRVLDGENFADMKDRGMKCLQFLESKTESNILVVTHGFFLRMMIACAMFGQELTAGQFKKFAGATRTQNTGISVLEFGDTSHPFTSATNDWRLFIYNDHAHLG